jgi:arsenate reductase
MTQKTPLKVLFVCVGNACRSQMAEGFGKMIGKEDFEIWSAGSRPCGWVYSGAVEAMKELDIDISGAYSKGIPDVPAVQWDCVVTMGCGDNCPTVAAKERRDWNIPDPVGLPVKEFRAVRDGLRNKIQALFQELTTARDGS